MLLTLIILSGSFGFSSAKGKGFEGGFPGSSGLSKYRLGNMGEKREPEPEIQYEPSEEKPAFKINRREKPSSNQKSSKDSESSKIRFRGLSGTYTSDFQEVTS